ncbi:MAG: DUF2817 domain-containing protein [Planctomycetaceae bacterium]|nr:DUF2817 domain-containing protein [Planctomycetaceae bacterium]
MVVGQLDAFSPDYATARNKFRGAVDQPGWMFDEHLLPEEGPAGESLTVDVLRYGVKGSRQTLVISSGLHGVEGFFGSAVQREALRLWTTRARPRVNVVLIHSLNPFGFAWLRRSDAQNVDLNRNFLLDGELYEGTHAAYSMLDGLLNPQRPPGRFDLFRLKALPLIARYGMPALRQAVAGGQYDYPRGLFFGGKRPASIQQYLAEHLNDWLSDNDNVLHLDFHTGLGAHGQYKLLLDPPVCALDQNRMLEWFGAGVFEASDTQGIAYKTRGGLGRWLASRRIVPNCLSICAEFGTYGPTTVVAGLRAENQAHYFLDANCPGFVRAKRRLKELFCPHGSGWRTRGLRQGLKVIDQAETGLARL